MMTSIQLDDKQFVDAVANAVAAKVMPQLEVLVKQYYQPDKGLNQQEAADVLGCDRRTLMKYYFYQPGFPHFTKGTQFSFSRKAIEKWMLDNQIRA